MKKYLKKLLLVKVENIFIIISIIVIIKRLIRFISLEGFNPIMFLFLFTDIIFTIILSYLIKDSRNEMKKDLLKK